MQADVNRPSKRACSAGSLFQQKGMMLVLVMVYLLAMSLLLTSTVSSSTLQLKMMSNQSVYQAGEAKLNDQIEIIKNLLSTDGYSASILALNSILNDSGKLDLMGLDFCQGKNVSGWLLLNYNQEPMAQTQSGHSGSFSYLALLTLEAQEQQEQSLETLVIQQCTQLENTNSHLLMTTILTRQGTQQFNLNILSKQLTLQIEGVG